MALIQKIIDIGISKGVKYAQLYVAAKICYDNPTKGITVQNKYAPLVIKDVAFVAKQFIPTLVINEVSDMVGLLRTKNVTQAEIDEFITIMDKEEDDSSKGYKEIFLSICSKGSSYLEVEEESAVEEVVTESVNYSSVYGDYAAYTEPDTDHECNTFEGTPSEKLAKILIP